MTNAEEEGGESILMTEFKISPAPLNDRLTSWRANPLYEKIIVNAFFKQFYCYKKYIAVI
jgi:hypothetical protein